MSRFAVEASFSFQVTVPGPEPYTSAQSRSSVTVTEEVDADSFGAAQDLALTRTQAIARDIKLMVANEAGIGFIEDENGVVHVSFGEGSGEGNVTPISSAPSAGVQSGAKGSSLPVITWDGQQVRVFDNREAKASGKYKPNAPDFKIIYPDGSDRPYWLVTQDGSANKAAETIRNLLGG